MRLSSRLLALGLVGLLNPGLPSLAGAQQDSPAATVDPEFLRLPKLSDIDAHISRRREARLANDESTAELELENVLRLREVLGLRSLVPLGIALRLEGRRALAAAEVERGIKRLAQAAILIPDTPGVHYELGLAQIQHGGEYVAGLRSLVDGARARARGFENGTLLLSDTIGVLGSAWFLALSLFLVLQLIRYLDMAGHDLCRVLRGVSALQGRLLVLILLSAPVALGLGLLPLLVLGLGLVGLYQTRAERVVTVAGFVGILALAGLSYVSAPLLSFRDSEVRAIHQVATRAAGGHARAKVERMAQSNAEAAFVLGLDARRRGDLVSAETWYRRALAGERTAARLNNLANVLLFSQKPKEAKALYEEAAALGTHAEPALNLASVLVEEGDTAAARLRADAGRALAPALAEKMRVEVVGVPAVRKVRDAPYDEAVLLPMLLAKMEGSVRSPLLDDLAARLLGGIPAIVFAAALVLLSILLIAIRGGPERISTACERCGAPAHRGPVEPHCETCESVFFETTAADPKVRFQKEQEIRRRRRFERWRERLLSPLAGGGDLVTGHPFIGFGLLFLLSFSIAHVLWLRSYGFYPWPDWSEAESWRIVVSGLIAIPVTIVSLRRGLGV